MPEERDDGRPSGLTSGDVVARFGSTAENPEAANERTRRS